MAAKMTPMKRVEKRFIRTLKQVQGMEHNERTRIIEELFYFAVSEIGIEEAERIFEGAMRIYQRASRVH